MPNPSSAPPTAQNGPGKLSFSDWRTIATAGGAGLAVLALTLVLLGALPVRLADYSSVAPFAASAAVLAAILYSWKPRWLFVSLILAALTFYEILESVAIPLGFMKVYIHDIVFGLNVLLIAFRTSVGRTPFRPIPFNSLVLVYFAVGVWGLFNGLILKGNAYDEVLGDFRRAFLYFMNYFVVLFLVDDLTETRRLRKILLAGCVFLMIKGFFQVATGQFYYRRFGDAAHVLSHYELTFLSFAIFYGLGKLLFQPGVSRLTWAAISGAGLVITIVGNYRASWLGLIAGLAYMFVFLPGRKKLQLTLVGMLFAAFVTVAIVALWDTDIAEGRSTLGEEIVAKANVKQTTSDVNVIWRFQSYSAALEQVAMHPYFGGGLGTYLTLQISTSTGSAILTEGHNIHNSALWLLMIFGIIGVLPIACFHVLYLVHTTRFVRSTRWLEGRITVMACGAYYVAMIIATAFENFLENATPIIVFSSLVALTGLMIYYERGESAPD